MPAPRSPRRSPHWNINKIRDVPNANHAPTIMLYKRNTQVAENKSVFRPATGESAKTRRTSGIVSSRLDDQAGMIGRSSRIDGNGGCVGSDQHRSGVAHGRITAPRRIAQGGCRPPKHPSGFPFFLDRLSPLHLAEFLLGLVDRGECDGLR